MGYLILSRRINERISIGQDIEIMISDIRQDDNGNVTVDLAIDAPKDLEIKRKMTHMEEQRYGAGTKYKSRQRNTRN